MKIICKIRTSKVPKVNFKTNNLKIQNHNLV
jgi:hypothetical protein